jgi:hypothetical protein
MAEYPTLRSVLGGMFSIQTGLSDDAQKRMLKRSLQNTQWREDFQTELRAAATNRQTSWMELLANDKYEVCDAESEEEARRIAISLLWATTFPGQDIPEHGSMTA